MYKPNKYYIRIEAAAEEFGLCGKDITVDLESVDKIKDRAEAMLSRIEDFTHCWIKIVDEEDLPKYYWGVDDAYDKARNMYRALEEAVDAVKDIKEAWDKLESNIDFLFNYVGDNTKGVIA